MKKILLVFFLSLLIFGCGYKVVDESNLRNFYISKITNTGDNRINFKIKNKLLFSNPENKQKPLSLTIDTNKRKNIHEKNEKNEITKYKIDVEIKVKYAGVSNKIYGNFVVNASKILDVKDQQSSTLNRERKLIDIICDSLADEILEEIYLRTK